MWQLAQRIQASELFVVFSYSLECLRKKLSQAKERSLTQRHLTGTNPLELGGLEEGSTSNPMIWSSTLLRKTFL